MFWVYKFLAILLFLFLMLIAYMNLTPGHFQKTRCGSVEYFKKEPETTSLPYQYIPSETILQPCTLGIVQYSLLERMELLLASIDFNK
jgi:hypothetical protein